MQNPNMNSNLNLKQVSKSLRFNLEAKLFGQIIFDVNNKKSLRRMFHKFKKIRMI